MNRIDERFKKLKEENKKALIPYICCGDPSVEDSEKLVYALEEAGADIIELGIPYSDPLADGPVIFRLLVLELLPVVSDLKIHLKL